MVRLSLRGPLSGIMCRRVAPLLRTVSGRGGRGRTITGVHGRFSTGMSRRLGAPLASVSKCTRVVVGKLMHPRSVPEFSRAVCGRTHELLALVRSVVGLSGLSSRSIRLRGRSMSLFRLAERVIDHLSLATTRQGVRVRLAKRFIGVRKVHRVLSRVVCGVARGTMGCGGRGKGMAV